jgi:hypothetical protein
MHLSPDPALNGFFRAVPGQKGSDTGKRAGGFGQQIKGKVKN